ncbi:MAG: imidazole glycerol phosphate synthase subunit HisH [Candidatus Dadabacteria bacterium]
MISIVDYGMGNLRSVKKAFESLGFSVALTRDPEGILSSSGLVLPGVGAFGDCMKNLEEYGLSEPIRKFIYSGKPFLGICLGLQLLFEESDESPGIRGLGILKGRVIRFPINKRLKIPHMGWNRVYIDSKLPIVRGITSGSWFYFVHSYFPEPEDKGIIAGRTQYGIEFTSAIQKENIFACQFHPEKSSIMGLKLLENFAFIAEGEKE